MEDGKIPKFSIEDVTPDIYDEVLDFFEKFHFHQIYGSVIMKCLKLYDDQFARQEYIARWRRALEENLSLVAFVENDQGGKREIVGCNIMDVVYQNKQESLSTFQSPTIKKIVEDIAYAVGLVDPYKKYGVNKCLYAIGLNVDPKYRGQGLGMEILKARLDLMKAVGLKCTVTAFSGYAAQKSALKAGYEVLSDVPYDQFKYEDGSPVYPDIECKSMLIMAKGVD
ncbi:hypothetical protein L9F63_014975 [Diploptera punctata]|uniref:N-acetyltransferase domain-containing protein n=1 Tax=Diploptera punctata TaxID=6984 RepID=A0AAD8A7A4_DIPPU|nr:hypothetical protein L9F63_014975 [Diploptera punctata]